jgi:hypothetical protein
MLELCKEILTKVSFDRYLFQKELKKAIKWIKNPAELSQLRSWCLKEFGERYSNIIEKTFRVAMA